MKLMTLDTVYEIWLLIKYPSFAFNNWDVLKFVYGPAKESLAAFLFTVDYTGDNSFGAFVDVLKKCKYRII